MSIIGGHSDLRALHAYLICVQITAGTMSITVMTEKCFAYIYIFRHPGLCAYTVFAKGFLQATNKVRNGLRSG